MNTHTMDSITLGPIVVDVSGGTLAVREPGQRLEVHFAWRGRPCQAELDTDGMRLAAIAARIPSTADPEANRPGTMEAVADLPLEMPEGWRMCLLPDHRIRVETDEPLDSPPTAVGLLSRMVRFALALDPYLDRLEAAGTEPPGNVKSCPG
jgi:hypothetical protein